MQGKDEENILMENKSGLIYTLFFIMFALIFVLILDPHQYSSELQFFVNLIEFYAFLNILLGFFAFFLFIISTKSNAALDTLIYINKKAYGVLILQFFIFIVVIILYLLLVNIFLSISASALTVIVFLFLARFEMKFKDKPSERLLLDLLGKIGDDLFLLKGTFKEIFVIALISFLVVIPIMALLESVVLFFVFLTALVGLYAFFFLISSFYFNYDILVLGLKQKLKYSLLFSEMKKCDISYKYIKSSKRIIKLLKIATPYIIVLYYNTPEEYATIYNKIREFQVYNTIPIYFITAHPKENIIKNLKKTMILDGYLPVDYTSNDLKPFFDYIKKCTSK